MGSIKERGREIYCLAVFKLDDNSYLFIFSDDASNGEGRSLLFFVFFFLQAFLFFDQILIITYFIEIGKVVPVGWLLG